MVDNHDDVKTLIIHQALPKGILLNQNNTNIFGIQEQLTMIL